MNFMKYNMSTRFNNENVGNKCHHKRQDILIKKQKKNPF